MLTVKCHVVDCQGRGPEIIYFIFDNVKIEHNFKKFIFHVNDLIMAIDWTIRRTQASSDPIDTNSRTKSKKTIHCNNYMKITN